MDQLVPRAEARGEVVGRAVLMKVRAHPPENQERGCPVFPVWVPPCHVQARLFPHLLGEPPHHFCCHPKCPARGIGLEPGLSGFSEQQDQEDVYPQKDVFTCLCVFVFPFYSCTCVIWKFRGWGLHQTCSCWPTPQPQQHRI